MRCCSLDITASPEESPTLSLDISLILSQSISIPQSCCPLDFHRLVHVKTNAPIGLYYQCVFTYVSKHNPINHVVYMTRFADTGIGRILLFINSNHLNTKVTTLI